MLKSLKNIISRNLLNAMGWRTNRRIIVIESDDWGSIRMPNKKAYYHLLKKGIRVDLCPYNKYDTLANTQDFHALFDILENHSDIRNKHPVITFNTNVANPIFDSIEKDNYEKYYYESFTKTLNEYYTNEDVFSMWREGINKNFIYPQFHGREHINFKIWLDLIKNGHPHLKEAFQQKLFGLSYATSPQINVPFLASHIYDSKMGKALIEDSIKEGSEIFKGIFGFKSKSFIAPLYAWSRKLEPTLAVAGISYLQGADKRKEYDFKKKRFHRSMHIMGNTNDLGQVYLHRNCTFEPSIFPNRDNIGSCLKEIENAFFWKKPAIISMHRVNFIGALEESNRNQNLRKFNDLLTETKKKWPNVEFMHSSDLGDLIKSDIV